MKKILITIFSLIIFAHAAFTQEIFKVTSVNFDTSNSLIFLTSPDNTTEAIMKNIKLIKLQNPKRVYFDINSAVLTAGPQNWFLNSGGITQIKINQFSNTPNKIRIVFYLDEDFDQSKISFLKVNNNIVIKFKDGMCKDGYFQNTYREEKSSSSDFYENLSISSEEIDKIKKAVNLPAKDEVLNQIQQSFKPTASTGSNIKPVSLQKTEPIKKELKLKSKYYLNSISLNPNGFLISGFGVVGIEKPMYLTEPARVVFDLPNTILSPELRNKELKFNEDTIKMGQFEANKTRIVITSTQLEKYFPIFSTDNQSILFVKSEDIDISSLFTKTTDAISYQVKKINPLTDEFIIAFNSPVIHSIKRDGSKLKINLYNALRYNDLTFRNTVAGSNLNSMKIDLMPQVGLKLSLPLEKDSVVTCYLGADGKSIKISVKGTTPKINQCSTSEKNITLPKCNGQKGVFIDPGHGGSDYGAIRAGINEKDINLDVAKRVQALLLNQGVNVYMTRDKDEFISLQDRTIFCAAKAPELFVSVHVNSSVRPEIVGIETHYYHQESLELAQTVHASLISHVKSKDRGLFKSKFYVINHTDVPAILVEIGFMSNDAERAELVSEQRKQQTAKAVAEGILKYLNKK